MKATEASEPYQFKDKIDEYLWKEHHILGGCCSSIESMKYAVAREVAENLTDSFIAKAYKFFGEHLWGYTDVKNTNYDTIINIDSDKLKEDFRKYMKGE